jgi:lipopolysaccharide export system permease protein
LVHSLKFIDLILKSSESFSTFFRLSLLAIPDLMTILLPITIALGIVSVYTRLQNDNELPALSACGHHPWALAKPALMVGLLGTALVYFINVFVLHSSFRQIRDVEHRLKNALPNVMVRQGVFNTYGDLTIYVQKKRGKQHLEGVMAYGHHGKELPYTMIARDGNFFVKDGRPTLVLRHGNRQTQDKEGQLSIVYFDETVVDLSASSTNMKERPKKPYEFSFKELIVKTRQSTNRDDRQRLVAEAFQRVITPWYSLVFASIVLAFFFRQEFRRGRPLRSTGFGLLGVFLVQIGGVLLNNLAARHWYALLASIILIMGSLLFSIVLLLRQSFDLKKRGAA